MTLRKTAGILAILTFVGCGGSRPDYDEACSEGVRMEHMARERQRVLDKAVAEANQFSDQNRCMRALLALPPEQKQRLRLDLLDWSKPDFNAAGMAKADIEAGNRNVLELPTAPAESQPVDPALRGAQTDGGVHRIVLRGAEQTGTGARLVEVYNAVTVPKASAPAALGIERSGASNAVIDGRRS
jgi:hypothetical protein